MKFTRFIAITSIGQHKVLNKVKKTHNEKVFSIFDVHTEMIIKGKAGLPYELGVRVNVVEEQLNFLLHRLVAQKKY